jgi:hypothetical protein
MAATIERILAPETEQSKKIAKILKDHAARLQSIRENTNAEMTAAVQILDEALAPLLTPEQKRRLRGKPFGPFGNQRPGRNPRRGGRRNPTGNPDVRYWTDQLDLNEEQVKRLWELRPRPRMPSTMEIQEGQSIERILLRWKNWQIEMDKALAGILTEEQKAKYARLKQEQRDRLAEILLEK